MSIKNLGLVFLMFAGVNLAAQTRITGLVKEPSGTPVADMYIIVGNPGSKSVIGYATTGQNGEFTISFTSAQDSVQIKTSRLDYSESLILIPNKNADIQIVVNPHATNLNEIVIRPEAVQRRGDTLNFFVRRFVSVQDRSIGDVIRKLPGIEVLSTGQINYQGRAINEFMVEGLDLMGGRYGGVVNNLSYDDVSTVQILENHEPVRAKKEISNSDRAAINLKLKEGSRNKYLLSFTLGVGALPLQWDNEASLMQFAVRKQTNVVYKGNNAGKRIDGELRSFYGSSDGFNDDALLKIPGSVPPLSNTQRYLFNNAHTVNVNRLYALSKYETIGIQGDFITDRQKQDSKFNTSYVIGKDSSLEISEASKQHTLLNKANFSVNYRNNAPAFFLNNVTKGHAEWSSSDASIVNLKETNQNLLFDNYSIHNNFSALKIINKKRVEIVSITSYSAINEELSVSNGVGERDYIQVAGRNLFSTNNSVMYGGKSGGFSYDLIAGADYKSSELESELKINDLQPDDSFQNTLRLNDLRIYISPSMRYSHKKMVFNVQLPVSYNFRRLNESGESLSKSGVFLSPSVGFRYDPSNVLRMSVNFEREQKKGDISSLNRGYILTNYRSLSKGSEMWSQDTINKVFLGFVLNKAEKLSSTYLTFLYTYRASNLIVSRDFNDIMLYRYILPLPLHSGGFSTILMHSKGFDGVVRKATVSSSYSIFNNRQIQGGGVVKNTTNSFYLNLEMNINLWEDSDLRYNAGWTNSLSKTSKSNQDIASGTINDLNQTLSFQSLIYKYFHFKVSAEHRKLFSAGSHIPSSFFLDSEVLYKRERIELSLELSNLLNTRDYAVKFLGSFLNTENLYTLRQRSVMFRARFSL